MWLGGVNRSRTHAGYIKRGEFPPKGECQRKSDAGFIGTEHKETVSRPAGEGTCHPLSRLGIERGSVLVSLNDQSAMRGQDRR
jgi:hypothetical protein